MAINLTHEITSAEIYGPEHSRNGTLRSAELRERMQGPGVPPRNAALIYTNLNDEWICKNRPSLAPHPAPRKSTTQMTRLKEFGPAISAHE